MPNISSGDYGSKTGINIIIEALGRSLNPAVTGGGRGGYGTLGPVAGIHQTVNGWNYPAPRQPGFGNVTGTGTYPAWVSNKAYPGPIGAAGNNADGDVVTFSGATYISLNPVQSSVNPATDTTNWAATGWTTGWDAITYKGDIDPAYIWDGSPTGASAATLAIEDYTPGNSNAIQAIDNPDLGMYYIGINKDGAGSALSHTEFFYSTAGSPITGAKPGYTEYTYPHPLRGGNAPILGTTSNPNKLRSAGACGAF